MFAQNKRLHRVSVMRGTYAVAHTDPLFPPVKTVGTAGFEATENGSDPELKLHEPWKLMVVDDEELVHQITKMVLRDFQFDQRPLALISCYSGREACEAMEAHPDIAAILLDVVMETDDAGLEVVRYIREELENRQVRIVLRTGQPGQAPEASVIENYDINDYKEKADLTSQKLLSMVRVAVRAYRDIIRVEYLASSNEALEKRVEQRTQEIVRVNGVLQKQVERRREVNRALRWSQSRLSEAQRIARVGSWEYDPDTGTMFWSDQVYRIFHLKPRSCASTMEAFVSSFLEVDRAPLRAAIDAALEGNDEFDFESRLVLHDGRVGYVRHQGKLERNHTDGKPRLIGVIQDITEQIEAESEMRKLSSAMEQIADSVMITDINGTTEYVNVAFEQMTGYSKEEAIGRSTSILKSGQLGKEFYRKLWRTILEGRVFSDVLINRRKDGSLFYEEKTIVPQIDKQGEITHFISSGRDITERIQSEERLHYLAHHDGLTGLPNRVLFQDRLDQAIARSRWRKRKLAIMFLDLDRFKIINDTLGHDSGDQLLKQAAERIADCVRDGDTVARLGGDEFAILLNDMASEDGIHLIAEKVLSAMKTSFFIDKHELFVTTSIGISVFPNDGESSKKLLKNADAAMYRAKARGKNTFQFFASEDDARAVERLRLETKLRHALERGEFRIHLQPQVELSTNEVSGVEALLRWNLPDVGHVEPARFIPLLEELGLIIPVGEWVLSEACRIEKQRQVEGFTPRVIAVNLSIRQFHYEGFLPSLIRILDRTGLDPCYLELEVTENLLIEEMGEVSRLLNQIHEMGVRISIDDFGTGYSSLNYLKRLPFDVLKIDRSFVSDVNDDSDDAAIAAAIISLAQLLDLDVIAEGVETEGQLAFLRERGCHKVQGFLFCPPTPADQLDTLVAKQREGWQRLALAN